MPEDQVNRQAAGQSAQNAQTVQQQGPQLINLKQFNKYEEETEIDLIELFYEFKRRLLVIILAIVLGAGAAGLYTVKLVTPLYESTAMMYIISADSTLSSLVDLQIGMQLTDDYRVMITSRPVLEKVIEKTGYDLTPEELTKMISIKNPDSTRILTVTVTAPDPEMARTIADTLCTTSSDFISDIMELIPPKIFQYSQAAEEPSSPSLVKNVAIGGIAGMIIAMGIITLNVIFNDTIHTADDVTKYLELPVLAAVPMREAASKEDKNEKKNLDKRKKDPHRSRKKPAPVKRPLPSQTAQTQDAKDSRRPVQVSQTQDTRDSQN